MPPVLGNKRDEISDQMAWNRLKISKFSDIYSLICLATVLISLQMGFKRIKADKLQVLGRYYVCLLKSVNEADLWCIQVMSK